MNPAVAWLEDQFNKRWCATGRKNWLREHDVYEYYADAPIGSVHAGSMFELKTCVPATPGELSLSAAHQCAGPFESSTSTFPERINTELVITLCPHGHVNGFTRLIGGDK